MKLLYCELNRNFENKFYPVYIYKYYDLNNLINNRFGKLFFLP